MLYYQEKETQYAHKYKSKIYLPKEEDKGGKCHTAKKTWLYQLGGLKEMGWNNILPFILHLYIWLMVKLMKLFQENLSLHVF